MVLEFDDNMALLGISNEMLVSDAWSFREGDQFSENGEVESSAVVVQVEQVTSQDGGLMPA